jgi:serine/threonine protein kinase
MSEPMLVSKGRLEIRQTVSGDAAILRLAGSIDETFTGFDPLPVAHVALELSGVTRITSYGVRQWIRGRDQLSQSAQIYYLNCPPFFVDQLNMVLNFGGHGQVVTAFAPFSCRTCNSEKWGLIDVLVKQDELNAGKVPEERCPTCKSAMQMDEMPETYFGFVKTAAARAVSPVLAPLLAAESIYQAPAAVPGAPGAQGAGARVRKLVHDKVTYITVGGAIDKRFRSKSLIEGIEGEVVLDLRELASVAEDGREEWERLRAGLKERASRLILVDVPPAILDGVVGRNLSLSGAVVHSVMADQKCKACGKQLHARLGLGANAKASPCPACGGALQFAGKAEHQALLPKIVSGPISAATREVIDKGEALFSSAQSAAEGGGPAELKKKTNILGKYEIARALSVGGMAEVFLAMQKGAGSFEKPVALKRIRRSVLERRRFAVEHFLNEAKIAATLQHPNIAQIFDVGEEEGLLYLAMEYVHGKDLRVVSRRLADRGTKMHCGTALFIARELALALHHAYTAVDLNGRQLKAIHRDVSPHNVIIGFSGAVKLVDFGVATSATTRQDDPFEVAGKHNYMSPEQLHGKPLDARSDLFSLGTVLYELLAGTRPFARNTPEETQAAINETQYTPLSQVRTDLPAGVDRLLSKLLARKADDRFPDGNRVAEEIATFAQQAQLVLSGDWLRDTLPTLFTATSSGSESEGPPEPAGQTPLSDSFSLHPTGDLASLQNRTPSWDRPPIAAPVPSFDPEPTQPPVLPPPPRPEPAVSNKSGSLPAVSNASGSLPAMDEQTISRIINPTAAKKSRTALIAVVFLLAAAVVFFLWWYF